MTKEPVMIRPVPILFLALVACGDSGGQSNAKVCSTNSGMGVLADHDVPCDPGGNASWQGVGQA